MSLLPPGLSFKNSLDAHATFYTLLDDVVKIFSSIPEYQKLKSDPEAILLICRILEVKIGKNTHNIDKKELVVLIYQKIFGEMTPEEKSILKSHIQFLYDNGKIKGVSVLKSLYSFGINYIKSKFI